MTRRNRLGDGADEALDVRWASGHPPDFATGDSEVNPLLASQIVKSRTADEGLDVAGLVDQVATAYEQHERDLRRVELSMSRMVEEIEEANRDLERTVAERTAELRSREVELRAKNAMLDAALANMSQGLAMFDSGLRLMMHNDRYAEMFELPKGKATPGMFLGDFLALSRFGAGPVDDAPSYVDEAMGHFGASTTSVHQLNLGDGRAVTVIVKPMPDGGWVATYEDVTARKAAEAKIAYMAQYDALTALPNRSLLKERLEISLAHVRRGEQLAVLCLDLDRFKTINEAMGLAAGDQLLKDVAARLRACVRDTDTLARVGGDEFTIIQTNISGPVQAEVLAAAISEAFEKEFQIEGHDIPVELSVGIAIAPDDGVESHELLKNADLALHGSKADGRGMFRFFESHMDARMKARRALELELRHAVSNEEFVLFYQPVLNLRRNRIASCEALLRWRHPERGLVSPLEFIPVAEEMGLIVPIGEWVIRKACQDAARWPRDIGVAVNLSPSQLSSKVLAATVIDALDAAQLDPERLELEITEAVLMQNTEHNMATLHRLRGLGVSISLDDFGTGFSSLSYLRSFPFDRIKIDRSFVSALNEGAEAVAIIRAVVELAESLRMATTAEGVETRAQLEQIRRLGCSDAQGYLYSRPIGADELKAFFAGAGAQAAA